MTDIYLRAVPSDADPDDVRLYDPETADAPASGGQPMRKRWGGVPFSNGAGVWALLFCLMPWGDKL